MEYKKFFAPELIADFRRKEEKKTPNIGDRRNGTVYCYREHTVLTVNIALATGRPLLVRGNSGCGKSSLAYNIANVLKRRYYEYVVTSQSKSRDLLWYFDAVRRLGDVQASSMSKSPTQTNTGLIWENYNRYIEPGILWWVFDYESAKNRGLELADTELPAKDPVIFVPEEHKNKPPETIGSVVLIDEIDKADPDFANNLLVPLGSLEFSINELQGKKISFKRQQNIQDLPLVVITTNEERRLPQAFLRRCVILHIDEPSKEDLITIGTAIEGKENITICEKIADAIFNLSKQRTGPTININVAEYLDAVRASLELIPSSFTQEQIDIILKVISYKENNLPKIIL